MKIILILIISCLLLHSNAKTAQEWKSRVVYELMTDRFAKTDGDTTPCQDLNKRCGGTFKGILNNLDYIQGLGCNAIWMSPVVANTEDSYHGYWTQNFYQINEHFGTEQDLRDLIKACHERDIWVMVDVIVNHVGYVNNKDFSSVVPFNDPSHYHEDIPCDQIKDDDYEGLEKCWLYGLPDLNQENEFVRKTLLEWVKNLVKEYEIDGLRLDALKHVPRTFWSEFSKAAGVFTLGENFDPEVPYLASYQGPVDSLLNFPLRSTLEYTFLKGGSMNSIEIYYNGASATWPDMTVLANFLSNHDLTRFLHNNDNTKGFKAAIAFCLCSVGIPTIYYGDEQGFGGGADPGNREPLWTNMNSDNEFYQFIKKINDFRKESKFYNEEQVQRYMDDSFYAFSRGKYLFAYTNSLENQERTIEFHPYSEDTKVCNLFFPDDCVEVKDGKFLVILNAGEVKILIPQEKQEDDSHDKKPIIEKEKLAANIKEMASV